ncbi:MAG: MBG domain-containing protein, partial [Chloroflexi bacterium]|nr:MBG domain-containing protein [Chloroflexota bacterium]
TVDDLKGLSLSSGDGALTLSWDASDPSPTAPTEYMLRWRKAGETTWLNRGFPAGWKTSYALDAAYAGPADGDRYMSVSDGSATVSGLENGVAYEVQARGARGTLEPRTGERKVFVFLRTDWQGLTGTPGAAQTTLSITPSSPSRQYGETDDLGFTVSGLKSGDAATDVLTGALSRASGEDAGDYAIGMGTLAVASAHAGKYALPTAPSVTTYTITPRPVTAISGVTVNARASDGTTDATFDTSAANGTGVLSAELADFRAGGLAVSGAFPAAVPGTHDVGVTYSLQDHGSFKAANYSLSATSDTLRGELTAVAACAAGMMLFADGAPAEGGAPVTVTVGLSSPAGVGGASATLTASGTATGDDYTLSPTTVAIAEGATAGAATITVIDDAVDDDDETIVLNAALSGSSLTAGPLTLTIADNDAPATPVAAAGCAEPAGGDYDADDDGLIEVSCLAQLRAINADLDGDGTPSISTRYNTYNVPLKPVYAAAFPGAASGMGCPQTGCIGYELTTDLDFDRNGNGRADADDGYFRVDGYKTTGWTGIGAWGEGSEPGFAAIFEGNGHVIRNLHVHNSAVNGLFKRTLDAAVIRNVGLEDVLLNGNLHSVAGLVGQNGGTIINSYTTGQVSGTNAVGGLVGATYNSSMIIGSYSTATVTGSSDDVGGLVGGNQGTVIASYATGNVTGTGEADDTYRLPSGASGNGHATGGLVGLNYPDQKIIASYATGTVTAPKGWKVGGLAGFNLGSITASYSTGTVSGSAELSGLAYSDNSWNNSPYARDSYWDTVTSGQATSVQGVGKTTAELQSPTGYAGIYADWNLDLDGDGSADDPWDFGTSCQYPVLKYGGLNPDDQRAPWPCAAGATPQSQRMFVTAHIDDHAAGIDEMAVLSVDLPQGVTMTPAFRSDHYSYELTVPDDTDGLTFAGRFDPEKRYDGRSTFRHLAFAVLLAGDLAPADLEAIWLGPPTEGSEPAYPVPNQLLIANSVGAYGPGVSMHGETNRVELPPDATTVVYL